MEFAYVFLRWDFLSMYTVYCTNYSKGNECLERSLAENEELREFIDVRREGSGGGGERERWRERERKKERGGGGWVEEKMREWVEKKK